MKSILQPIKPQYCELIASGKKTIEVRKTRPKLDVPFKVYIYCTRGKLALLRDDRDTEEKYKFDYWDFVEFHKSNGMEVLGGKVIGEYVCDEIQEIVEDSSIPLYFDNWSDETCLTDLKMREYANGKPLYLWHISDLKIYDKPKELSEFEIMNKEFLKECPYRIRVYNNPDYTNGALLKGSYVCNNSFGPDFCRGQCGSATKPLTRPPQSWCYVEEV